MFEASVHGQVYRLSDEMLCLLKLGQVEYAPQAHLEVGRVVGEYLLAATHNPEQDLHSALKCASVLVQGWSARDYVPLLKGVAEGYLLPREETSET